MMTQDQTTTLLKGIEVWQPSSQGDCLELCAGTTPPRGPIVTDSQDPVAVAQVKRSPTIGNVEHHGFDKAKVLALPAFRDNDARGVLALHFEPNTEDQGAAEVWRPNERGELARTDAWYAGLSRFATISEYVKFPRRAGLPGRVWADRFPRVMGSLGSSPDFVRAAGAKAEGLSTAIGIPFMTGALQLESVLVLLSSSRAPVAKVMEVWSLDPETKELKIVSADYGPYVDLAPVSRRQRSHLGDGIAGRVYRDHTPWMTCDLLGVEFPRGEKFQEYGFSVGVGFPVFVGEQLVAVVTLLN